MIRHLFAQNAVDLSSNERMACVAERLYDMGYRYDCDTNTHLQFNLAAVALGDGHQMFAVEDFKPVEVHYVMPSADGLTQHRTIVMRSGPVGELLADDPIVTTLEYVEGGVLSDSSEPQQKLLAMTTVAEFLAQKHPHPVQSSLRRIAVDLRQLVAV